MGCGFGVTWDTIRQGGKTERAIDEKKGNRVSYIVVTLFKIKCFLGVVKRTARCWSVYFRVGWGKRETLTNRLH